jgi:hypothetical protein
MIVAQEVMQDALFLTNDLFLKHFIGFSPTRWRSNSPDLPVACAG